MKICTVLACTLVTIGALSCTQPTVELVPKSVAASARGGSSTPTSPNPTTTPLPALPPNPTPINDLGPIMPSGTWTVKSYFRGGSDATAEFAGCTFLFSSDGQVTATDGKGKSSVGGWSATVGGVTYYGGAPTVTSLAIYFDKKAPRPFDRLSNRWNVNLATTGRRVIADNVEPLAGERIEFSL